MAVFDAIDTGQPAWRLQPPALARVRRSMGTRQVSEVRRKIESGAFWCMASGETIENTRIFRVWEHATSKNRKSDALWCILVPRLLHFDRSSCGGEVPQERLAQGSGQNIETSLFSTMSHQKRLLPQLAAHRKQDVGEGGSLFVVAGRDAVAATTLAGRKPGPQQRHRREKSQHQRHHPQQRLAAPV